MFTVHHKVVAIVTALMVLVTTMDCVCGGATTGLPTSSTSAHACCGHDAGDEDRDASDAPLDHDRPTHDPACQHCQASAIPESQFAKHLWSIHDYCSLAFSTVANLGDIALHTHRVPRCDATDLSPPLGATTLLSLGCALNT